MVDTHREQVDAELIKCRNQEREILCRELGKSLLEIGELRHARPRAFIRSAAEVKDFKNLVDFAIARQQ